MNKYRQYVNSFVDRIVTTKQNATPSTATTTTQKEHTITITNSNKTTTRQPPGYARKMSQKKNPQRKEKRKIIERMQVMEKLNDVVCMEIQREVEDQTQAQQVDTRSRSTANEHTSTTTADAYGEDESSEAEVQQLSIF